MADEKALKAFISGRALGCEVSRSEALRPDLAGMGIFGAPVFAAAEAGDGMFQSLKGAGAVGGHHFLPRDWIPGARFVLSVFLPFRKRVKDANTASDTWPADEWLHARIEGQRFMSALAGEAAGMLRADGFEAVSPCLDPRFWSADGIGPQAASGPAGDGAAAAAYTSNWSERHVAFVCGLGTFGLSKGLITEKGVAGRLFSLVTDMELSPTPRRYGGLYEYCVGCGRCAALCPAGAIDPGTGKDHAACGRFLYETKLRFRPRYGCGKCQTGVPCESERPRRAT
ncbi:MAG: 4Fe-4S binding protein [Clostridiales Family XIII bacterium]|jgi:epoxyqueuosine reductase QueG|nr:4Fe-4S binding protein [Clostridiales Family XIII bacterium]